MSTSTEQQLRELFAADADGAPEAGDLATGAVRRVQRRRHKYGAVAAGVAALAIAGGLVALVDTGHQASTSTVPSISATQAPTGIGALPGSGSASCVQEYSPANVKKRAFAFDGTVTAIGKARTSRGEEPIPLASVTFRVNEWFAGGTGDTVTVDMTAPTAGSGGDPTSEEGPTYGIGTRLLVSGQPRWGGGPLDEAIAWTCGFTRYYDAPTAAAWRAAK
jgi:hypothetical protein